MIAKLIEKGSWKDGIYPSGVIGLAYRTRMLKFQTEDGTQLRLNVQDRRPNSMVFNKLKVGDRIKEFKLLSCKRIINPESSFVLHSDGALF